MKDEARYVCESYGEEIVVPINLSAWTEHEYVEACPVCCYPNVVHVEVVRGSGMNCERMQGCRRDDILTDIRDSSRT